NELRVAENSRSLGAPKTLEPLRERELRVLQSTLMFQYTSLKSVTEMYLKHVAGESKGCKTFN
ncbi:hypothetical protein J6590_106723, partial [Homalodisca vitripennis]